MRASRAASYASRLFTATINFFDLVPSELDGGLDKAFQYHEHRGHFHFLKMGYC